jgi:3-oxoacyl-[acyl-carrier protein] reductase
VGVSGRFTEKTVLVTGGAHGIGLATATAFAREGARVYVLDRDGDRLADALETVAAAGGPAVAGGVADVRSRIDVERSLDACATTLGPVDVLVNNAGGGRSRHTLALDEALWDELVSLNLTAAFQVAQAVARAMVERGEGGVILNASSSDAIAAEPGMTPYAASKAALLALTRAAARELRGYRIRMCAVLPGEISTYPTKNVELKRLYESRIALGRTGRPDEAAAAYLYLASEDAAHLSGVAFVVDGGMLAWE